MGSQPSLHTRSPGLREAKRLRAREVNACRYLSGGGRAERPLARIAIDVAEKRCLL